MNKVLNKIISNGYEAYIVGGYVRDFLLGKKSYDIDICTNATIDEISKLFDGIGIAYNKYFSYHFKEDGYSYTITTYRKELEYLNNKPSKIEITNLKTDLLRRDFTVNTLLMDNDNNVIDLLNVKDDLYNKKIKVVGDINKKFCEDKTRIMRAIRFSLILDFEFDDEIIEYITNNKDSFKTISKDYIKKELDIIFDNGKYNKFYDLVNKFNIEDYFDIEFIRINDYFNKYEVWSKLNNGYNFSKREIKIINEFKNK